LLTSFTRYPAGAPGNGDDFENVFVLLKLDATGDKTLYLGIGAWKGKGTYNNWPDAGWGSDGDIVAYNGGNNEIYTTLTPDGLPIGEIIISRVDNNYIEGRFDVRVKRSDTGAVIRFQGYFRGKLRA
jgi:hypothetical protein